MKKKFRFKKDDYVRCITRNSITGAYIYMVKFIKLGVYVKGLGLKEYIHI